MHNNALLLSRYAAFLTKHCLHQTLVECVSTSPSDIHLRFDNGFYLSIRFYKAHTFFIVPQVDHFPKKNILHQLKSIVNQNVTDVKEYPYDRGIEIQFDNQSLHIQCFGRRSGILVTQDYHVVDHFKTIQPPETFTPQTKSLSFSQDPSIFQKDNPFVTSEMNEELRKHGFFESGKYESVWLAFEKQLQQKPISICKSDNGSYTLTTYPTEHIIDTYDEVGDAMHDFGKLFMGHDRLVTLKTSLQSNINKTLKKLRARKTKIEKHLEKLNNGEHLKQQADIIMANLHAIPPKATSVELFDFYNNETIQISLKESLNAQQNAERYYQKSKNVHVEIQHNKKLVNGIEKQIAQLEADKASIETSEDFRKLQSFNKKQTKQVAAEKINYQLPYRTYTYKSFEIWVGKSAKHNDQLLKLAHKNDLWFHARGVAGSHVLLKNAAQQHVPEDVLEYAASLAARFSKNQHESLAAVIYTNPKYVRKFKGALPGQVRVDREEVILVAPYEIKS